MAFVDEHVAIDHDDFERKLRERLPGIRTFHFSGPLAEKTFNSIIEAEVKKIKANVEGIKIFSQRYDIATDKEVFKVRIFLKD